MKTDNQITENYEWHRLEKYNQVNNSITSELGISKFKELILNNITPYGIIKLGYARNVVYLYEALLKDNINITSDILKQEMYDNNLSLEMIGKKYNIDKIILGSFSKLCGLKSSTCGTKRKEKENIKLTKEQLEIISSNSIGCCSFSGGSLTISFKEDKIDLFNYNYNIFKNLTLFSYQKSLDMRHFNTISMNLFKELNKEMISEKRIKLPRQFILDNFNNLGLSILIQNKAGSQFWGNSVMSDIPQMMNICLDKFSYDDNLFFKDLLKTRFNINSEIKKVKPLTNGDDAYNIQIKDDINILINIIKPYIFNDNLYKISYKEYLRKNYKENNFDNYYINLVNNYKPSFMNAEYYFDEFEEYFNIDFQGKSKYKFLTIRDFKNFIDKNLSAQEICDNGYYSNLVKFISRFLRKQIKIAKEVLNEEYSINGLSLKEISDKYNEQIDDILFLKQLYNIEDSNLHNILKMKNLYKWELVEEYLDVDFNETANSSSSLNNITLREFKSFILQNKSLDEISKISNKHLISFFSTLCQGEINITKETLEKEYKSGQSLENIINKYNINCDFKTYLRRLYDIDLMTGKYGKHYVNGERVSKTITNRQKEIIYGTMLGDCCRFGNGISFKHGLSQEIYLRWMAEELKDLQTEKGVYYYESFDKRYNKSNKGIGFYTKSNTELENINKIFYTNNDKQVSKEICDFLTPLSIAVWICDDAMTGWGYHLNNNCNPSLTICTDSFNDESCNNINNMFKEKFNIISYTKKRSHPYSGKIHNRTHFSTTETQKLFNLIKPIIAKEVPSMLYKVDYDAYLIYRAAKNLPQDKDDLLLNSLKLKE